MNVTQLARQLRMNTKDLLDILPAYGFDIGKKAIKIDDKTAQQVMKKWRYIKADLEAKKAKDLEEKKKKEKEMRKETGQSIILPDLITVKDFAEKMNMPVSHLIMELMKNGILANQNQNIDFDTASIMAEEFGFTVLAQNEHNHENAKNQLKDEVLEKALSGAKELSSRPPIIVVMGHVDHGKTKLLDTIRKTNIIDTEAGGITQHIGAYQTIWKDPKTKEERELTFIDTPGHEAFTMMRSRGARVADIAVLIVAADDSVKPQTVEALNIIKAAKLPFVVAINKIDKEGADAQKVKTDLSQYGVLAEEWGGNVPMIEISAKGNINIDKLLDVLLLVTDLNAENIQADPKMPAVGTVIESHVDKNTGPVATVLVQAGTLKKNDKIIIGGEIYGKVKAMKDYKNELIDIAGPSVPTQIIGFKVAPEVGDVMDLNNADQAVELDIKKKRNQQTGAEKNTLKENSNENVENKKTLNLVVKADVLGSLEAIIASLSKIRHSEVGVKIVGKGLGNITEDDVNKLQTSEGYMVGFNVNTSPMVDELMRDKKIEFKKYNIIYDLINWVKEELGRMLSDEKIITELGRMKVLAIFRKEKGSMIIGGKVESGKMLKGSLVRVKRNKVEIGKGKIALCKVGQAEMKEVNEGTECGANFEGSAKIEVGDVLEFYTEETKAREIIFE
ncbi:MAG: translation initiation factor IF-2 [Patescibacteria group bacterium]